MAIADLNKVIMVGRLSRDAELKFTPGGLALCKFSIANNRRKKTGDQWLDEVSFFDIVLWGNSASALSQYLTKGKQVIIEGELRQNRWEQDGQMRSKIEIIATNVQLCSNSSGNAGIQGQTQKKAVSENYQTPADPDFNPTDFDNADYDVPF